MMINIVSPCRGINGITIERDGKAVFAYRLKHIYIADDNVILIAFGFERGHCTMAAIMLGQPMRVASCNTVSPRLDSIL